VTSLCDTGPLVAFLNRRDPHHAWAVNLMKQVAPPLVTSEAVLTEAAYFLREDALPVDPLFELLERGALTLEFDLAAHWPRVRRLMARYAQMDLADASMVVMSELKIDSQVLTLDRRDFSAYRRHDRQVIPFVAPPAR
jgi:predicted nucleic acid-binding protein